MITLCLLPLHRLSPSVSCRSPDDHPLSLSVCSKPRACTCTQGSINRHAQMQRHKSTRTSFGVGTSPTQSHMCAPRTAACVHAPHTPARVHTPHTPAPQWSSACACCAVLCCARRAQALCAGAGAVHAGPHCALRGQERHHARHLQEARACVPHPPRQVHGIHLMMSIHGVHS